MSNGIGFYDEFDKVRRDVNFLKSLDVPSKETLISDFGGLLMWSGQHVGTAAKTIVTRIDPIVDVYGYMAFVFSSNLSNSFPVNVGIHGPSTSQSIVLADPAASEFSLFVDGGNTLKLQKTLGDDAYLVNGFFFIL